MATGSVAGQLPEEFLPFWHRAWRPLVSLREIGRSPITFAGTGEWPRGPRLPVFPPAFGFACFPAHQVAILRAALTHETCLSEQLRPTRESLTPEVKEFLKWSREAEKVIKHSIYSR